MPKAPRVIAGAGAKGTRNQTCPTGLVSFPAATRSVPSGRLHHQGESYLPYENRPGPRALSPEHTIAISNRSPRLPTHATLGAAYLPRARMAGVRRHWRLAKQLSPSLRATDYDAWFIAYRDGHLPVCTVTKLRWLIAMRAKFRRDNNSLAALRLSAAVWQLTVRIKDLPKQTQFNNSQII